MKEKHDGNYLPVWLQQLGYSTYFTGEPSLFQRNERTRMSNAPDLWQESSLIK